MYHNAGHVAHCYVIDVESSVLAIGIYLCMGYVAQSYPTKNHLLNMNVVSLDLVIFHGGQLIMYIYSLQFLNSSKCIHPLAIRDVNIHRT